MQYAGSILLPLMQLCIHYHTNMN